MDLVSSNPSVRLGRNVQISAEEVQLGDDVRIGDDARIECRRLVLGNRAVLEPGVTIRAGTFVMREGARLETRCVVASMGGPALFVDIGEQSLVAHDCKLLCPVAVLGDYVAVHNHTLISGRCPLVIGHNTWIGQNCTINSEARLVLGNNVGIGTYSSVYTHGYFGDLLEGCQVFKVAPVNIEDDVWILGSYNIISPGVRLGEKALVLTGSCVTRDVPPNHCVGGAPARDMTDRLVPYRQVTPDEKLSRIGEFLADYVQSVFPGAFDQEPNGFLVRAPFGPFRLRWQPDVDSAASLASEMPLLVFTRSNHVPDPPDNVTVFDLARRQYTRRRTPAEIRTITFLKSYRARFVPADRPRVELPPEYRELGEQ
jgi:acetyltransferase-like isoleucine patch superfamily enzyme